MVVVGDLLKSQSLHLLQVNLDTSNPGIDNISFDEVLFRINKIFVVLLLIFEPITFVLAKQSEEAVSHTL